MAAAVRTYLSPPPSPSGTKRKKGHVASLPLRSRRSRACFLLPSKTFVPSAARHGHRAPLLPLRPPAPSKLFADLHPNAEKGKYQESQEYYPDPSLASTELPDEQVYSQDGYWVEETDVGNDHSV